MSRNDIRPFRNARGGTFQAEGYSMEANATFLRGEPVVFNGSGFIAECANDPAGLAGIAQESSIDIEGRIRATGTIIPVIEPRDSQLWVCNNFATDGAATPATPSQANAIGRTAGLTLNGANWTVDTGAGNAILQIDDVIDRNGISLGNPSFIRGAGFNVIFRFLA